VCNRVSVKNNARYISHPLVTTKGSPCAVAISVYNHKVLSKSKRLILVGVTHVFDQYGYVVMILDIVFNKKNMISPLQVAFRSTC
jgi:hypothetical protein